MRNKRLAVYCGARLGNKQKFENAIIQLSNEMSKRQIDLVYGGGNVGLMGAIAKNVLKNNNQVFAIMPEFLQKIEGFEEKAQHTEIVENMSIRKQRMIDLSDYSLAMPGGPGTLEEITEVYSWHILDQIDNPCAFYNLDGYYQPMADMYNIMVSQGFLTMENRQKLFFSDSFEDIFDFFTTYNKV
ncbi:TIGR00730 family Rossman fold protein [Leuconostoc pseudomesenteroides]|uniref:LOG family protein n=1 Tax=Leuconostoc pseudomesenteroides TaxID=33968 RepID=UPI0039EA0A72